MRNSILRCLYSVNEELCRYGSVKELRLGTTVSVLLLWKRQYLICHIGDSRIYRCGRRGTRLLTQDHRSGRHGLLKCVGSFPFQKPDFYTGHIGRGQGFLLCTDGFSNRQEWDKRLFDPGEIYDEEQLERRLAASAAAVQKRGETDNLSAIYVKIW